MPHFLSLEYTTQIVKLNEEEKQMNTNLIFYVGDKQVSFAYGTRNKQYSKDGITVTWKIGKENMRNKREEKKK